MLVSSKMKETVPLLKEYFTYLKVLSTSRAGTHAPIHGPMTLLNANIVSGIRCKQCQILYIGGTGKTLQARLKQHTSNIKKGNQECLLYTHNQQQTLDILHVFGLESNFNRPSTKRKYMESKWIRQLKTSYPHGRSLK